jgi:hypothetical protein
MAEQEKSVPAPATADLQGDEDDGSRLIGTRSPGGYVQDKGLRCPEVADDGVQCHRLRHDDDPYAHDFAGPGIVSLIGSGGGSGGGPVDGGQKWSVWIKQVHAVRALLLDQIAEDGHTHYGLFDDPYNEQARQKAKIAEAVGLHVHYSKGGIPERITEEA